MYWDDRGAFHFYSGNMAISMFNFIIVVNPYNGNIIEQQKRHEQLTYAIIYMNLKNTVSFYTRGSQNGKTNLVTDIKLVLSWGQKVGEESGTVKGRRKGDENVPYLVYGSGHTNV